MIFVFYKLKDEDNIKEILDIAREMNIKVILIPRENLQIDYYKLKQIYDFDLLYFDNLLEIYKDKEFIFIETYGDKYLFEVDLPKDGIYVLGAEDIGIPLNEIEKVKNKKIVKIPIKVPGSYNVVSCFIMVLTELKLRKIL